MKEKYQNRESRPEDLQLIAELKDLIAERDQLIKKLIVRQFDGIFWCEHAEGLMTFLSSPEK